MPPAKTYRRFHEEKDRRMRLTDRASSFNGAVAETVAGKIHRPRTMPELLSARTVGGVGGGVEGKQVVVQNPKLTKLLLNVTIQRSIGPVMVLMAPESTVGDLIATALRQYVKEGRRPILSSTDPSDFDLHYSQFSLESLDRDGKLTAMGSRNFFVCLKHTGIESRGVGVGVGVGDGDGDGDGLRSAVSVSLCWNEADKRSKINVPWLKLMDFLL